MDTKMTKKYLCFEITDPKVFNNLMKYELNIDNCQEVFTYEIGKYFKGLSYWCVTNNKAPEISFEFDELNCVSQKDLTDRIITLASWGNELETTE
jgi:hypothetical protein